MIARFKIVGRDSSRLRYSATHRVTFPLNQYTTFWAYSGFVDKLTTHFGWP